MNGFDYKAYDKVIPDDSPEVARIMRERGVGRRRATHLATKAAAEAIDVSDVNLSQKESVLNAIVKHEVRNSQDLMGVMNHNGSSIDGHDVVKMLWACQKMGWVTFRERKGGYGNHGERPKIYAIKVTDKGYSAARAAALPKPVEAGTDMKQDGNVESKPPVTKVADLDIKDGTVSVTPAPDLELSAYQNIQALTVRAKKAEQLNAAARLLEAAGEDDLALQAMSKTEFTPLEREVITLCSVIWKDE